MMIPGRHLRLFLCLLLVAVGSFHLSARNLDEIKRSGKIYVAFTSDDLKNINYELAQEFARYLNVELIEVKIDWEEVFMQNGDIPEDLETNPDLNYTPDALRKADIICSTFTVIQWRKKLFGFAETLQSAELLMVRKDQSLPRGLEDLSGKTVAYVRSTTIEDRIKEINATLGGTLKLLPVESTQEAQSLIQQGKAYGIVLDADEALNFNAQSNQQFHIAFPVSDISKTAWATEKNNALIREVENYFETVASNGVLDEIFYRRFGITYSTYVDRLAKNLRLENLHRDLDDILASGKLVVALRERNFIYRENGQKQFMHALAEEFADYLGVSLEFVVTPYFGKYWEATDGQVYRDSSYTPDWFNYFDLACETIAPLDWRQNKVNTIPVYPSSYTVIARKETPILKLEDLKNLRGVTGPQTVYEDILRENGISNFYYAEMVNDYIPAVDRGDADYTIIYDAFYELSAHPGLEVKLDLGELNVSWALRKDQPDLEAEVRTFLARSQKQGLIGTLMKALRGNTLQAPEAFINSYYESFQTGQLPYVNYGADDGLPQEDIFSIFQDQKGYLWFGTNSGAVRYNGREMVVFNQDQGLPGNSVRDIQQDSSGVMYFATTNGIAKFARDTTVQVLLEGLSFSEVFIDSRNRHWFLGDNGVYRETRDGKIVFLNSAHPVLPDVVYHMTEDPRTGNLLLATVRGVYLFDPDGQSMDQLSNQDAYSLFIDVNDSLWISTRDGLYITHLHELQENRNWWTGRNLNRSLHFPVDIISDISSNKYGSVWLVSDSRILQVTSTDQQPIIYEQEIGIKNNKILSFLIDQEDNLWIGFSGGLQRLTNRKGLRNFYPGTIDSYIYSLMQDRMDRIWVASDNGVFHFQNNQLTNFSALHGLETNKFATALLPNGNVLLAHDEGLLEVEASSLRILRRMTFPNLVHSLENVFVTGKGEIFLLSGIHGVIYYLSSMDALPVSLKNKYTSNVFQLIEYQGRIIGGNGTGFVEFNGKEFVHLQESDCSIWSIHTDGQRIWVGTDCGVGLVERGRFDQMQITALERDPVIKSIIPARNKNYLWLGTNRGFSYYNSRTRSLEFTVNTKDGLSGDEITPGGLFLDNNDLLWVGTYHGISNFNIRAKSSQSFAPVCYIEKMFLNGEPKTPQNGEAFAHNENSLEFEISALSFADEASVEYEYYLRGTGNKYSAYSRGKEYRAQYTNLPPGKYEFIYRAKGKNNIWGYAEKYEFSIRKAWYNTWVFRLTVVFSFVLLTYLSYLVRIRTIKAQRNRLEQQVRERTHELEVANTEIEAQRDFARSQRDHIAQQQKAIVDSIQYAETIQSSLLPPPAQLEKHVSEYMVLFKPRDIVSGDFYWISEQDGAVYVAAADCTGHGVPGAFMSMLGMALMNEIVNKQNHIEPGELLNELRSRIMQTLHQRADPDSAKDGMDMVLCRYEPQNGRLQFAGANNPLYFVRDGELTEYKNDKMPVSIYEVMHPFLTREIKVRKGDSVYFFSDGYADQFGGPKGKKFKYRELKNLFLKHHKKPMGEQRQILDKTFERWKGNLEQIDDVVVVGLRF